MSMLTELKPLAIACISIGLALVARAGHVQRAPNYADATGRDWLFNHDIEEKKYAGEPTDDPGVDLFYLYPTSVYTNTDKTVCGICDIDDEFLRGPEGAVFYWGITGEVFGDITRVYAPYYRQVTVDSYTEMGPRWGLEHASEAMVEYCYTNAVYADVTNALTHYFTKINPNGERPFILAGHSQGSNLLRTSMERFFTNEVHRAWLKNLIACYAVGFGLGPETEERIARNAGAPFATNATDTGVYIMWNTEGPGTPESMRAGLWPSNAVASVNPLSWTRETDAFAPASVNLGGIATNDAWTVRPGMYDASNYVAHGTVVCSSEAVTNRYSREGGPKSLHNWDYLLYWENVHDNALRRIQTWKAANGCPANGQIPLVGQPIDYADEFNWVTNSIASTGITRDADALVFYLTVEMKGDSTCVPVTDEHKAKVYKWYESNVNVFEGYANIIMPAYRQMNMAAVTAYQTLYPTGPEFFDSQRRGIPRTDFFAALDRYFSVINPDGRRPFFFVGHSQGSMMIRVLLQDYFSREANKAKLENLIAAYALGCSFDANWIADLGIGLKAAEGADDTKVVVAWNTEGPDAQKRSFLVEDGSIAINPMNWTTNLNVWSRTTPDAMIRERAGYASGTHVLVTTNVTKYLPEAVGMGDKSLHLWDWLLWRDQIRANGFTRLAAAQGLVKVETNQLVSVADATWKIEVQGRSGEWNEAAKSPVDGFYYVSDSAQKDRVRLTYVLAGEAASRRFVNGETTTSFPMAYDDAKGVWSTTVTEMEIRKATKTGTPSVMLGVVAQRYPWNGILDIQYKTPYANSDLAVTFKANDVVIGSGKGTAGKDANVSFDLNAFDALRYRASKDVRITATLILAGRSFVIKR